MAKRIVIASWGSFGDVNPYVGLALGLRARGHRPRLVMPEWYRSYVAREGIDFAPLRPDVDPTRADLVRRIMDRRRGTEVILREILLPALRESYEDLHAAAADADLLVTHPITFAGPIVAERRGLPWVSTVLAPMSFFSPYDLPVLAPAPRTVHLRRLGPGVTRAMVGIAKSVARRWTRPVNALRAELGLGPVRDPVFEGQFSPYRVLALFSRVLAEPQRDWPANTRVTGQIFYDGPDGPGRLEPRLEAFLGAGPPPVVFTLGSSAVMAAGRFYHESLEAVDRLGVRAVLLVGKDPANLPAGPLPESVVAVDFAPHSEVFPRSAAVVHQGGAGTLGQALRSGRPELVVPYAHDQPDNAFRVTNLGVARTLFPRRYSAARVARELRELLDDPAYARRAGEVGREVRAEDGVAAACEQIEQVLDAGELSTGADARALRPRRRMGSGPRSSSVAHGAPGTELPDLGTMAMNRPASIPPPPHQPPGVERVEALARLLDSSIPVPGTGRRIGLDPLIGLIPGFGDVAGAALSAYIMVEAARLGVSRATLLRMGGNVAVEAVVGTIPLLGDLFDAGYKANMRNFRLLRRHLEEPGHVERASRGWLLAVVGGVVLLVIGAGALAVWIAAALLRAVGVG